MGGGGLEIEGLLTIISTHVFIQANREHHLYSLQTLLQSIIIYTHSTLEGASFFKGHIVVPALT